MSCRLRRAPHRVNVKMTTVLYMRNMLFEFVSYFFLIETKRTRERDQ